MRNRDGYVMVYVMITILILTMVAGGLLANASSNAAAEIIAIEKMKQRYETEGEMNKVLASLENEEHNLSVAELKKAVSFNNADEPSKCFELIQTFIGDVVRKQDPSFQNDAVLMDEDFTIANPVVHFSLDFEKKESEESTSNNTVIHAVFTAKAIIDSKLVEPDPDLYENLFDNPTEDSLIVNEERFYIKSVQVSVDSVSIEEVKKGE